MSQVFFPRRYFALADILIFLFLGAGIYGLISIGQEWRTEFHPVTAINLSVSALPRYALLSAIRGLVAYLLSLTFTLVIGYGAAKSRKLERIVVPAIDILQSIPPLGFMPGLALGLIALFPRSNIGLELTSIILIFTGQVWNMTFSFYSSVKSVPADYHEASTIIGLSWWQRLLNIELPFSAVGLAWNSVLSMAGGWFFLSVSESFTLGEQQFQIPGVGSYMAEAIKQGNVTAMIWGVVAMITIILCLDFLIWNPVLSWVRRFRLEDIPGTQPTESFMLFLVKDSRFIRWLKFLYRRYVWHQRQKLRRPQIHDSFFRLPTLSFVEKPGKPRSAFKFVEPALWILAGALFVSGCVKLFLTLIQVQGTTWLILLQATLYTFLRILGTLIISTLWAVPVGIWIGLSQKRIRIAQPIIQVLASFPAPMLYPLVLAVLFGFGMSLSWASMFLMLLGVQWYVLFNVLAGALRISRELGDTLSLMKTSRRDRWRVLYIPSVFPALVTGWVTAAGGAWNASMVAEYIAYKGKTLTCPGLGAVISAAADKADFPLLAASLTTMVVVVLTFNRSVWARVYKVAQTRFRMDM